jgi:hypothetical protein
MLGPDPKVDTERKRVTGPLLAGGKDTGVQLEVRTGGPSIGFEPVSSQMYKDTDITLGQVSTDEAIRFSAKHATLAVVAPTETSPFMIMWDPQAYPQFNTIADIGKMREDFVDNGPDQTLGNFDTAPGAADDRHCDADPHRPAAVAKEGLKPEDIATSEFVDESIGVGA